MALPATMKVLSLVLGLILVMLAAVLTDASIELLVRFSRAVGATSYGEAMGDAFDPLKYTPAVSVALAIVFVVINVGIATIKLMRGQIPMPKLFPDVHDWSSTWRLHTAAPVLLLRLPPLRRGDAGRHARLPHRVPRAAIQHGRPPLPLSEAPLLRGCDNRRFGAITAALLTVIFLAANFDPNIWDAFQFTGSSCMGDDVDCGGGGDSCLAAVILVAAAVSPMRPRSTP
uniref:Uncharacterized protein n=1 Tax=Oryza rufipogon TaxID=4529 RepID=A0A0E0QAT6_ORYRU